MGGLIRRNFLASDAIFDGMTKQGRVGFLLVAALGEPRPRCIGRMASLPIYLYAMWGPLRPYICQSEM
eukprot:10090943-Karenia_brevis.AAC.1